MRCVLKTCRLQQNFCENQTEFLRPIKYKFPMNSYDMNWLISNIRDYLRSQERCFVLHNYYFSVSPFSLSTRKEKLNSSHIKTGHSKVSEKGTRKTYPDHKCQRLSGFLLETTFLAPVITETALCPQRLGNLSACSAAQSPPGLFTTNCSAGIGPRHCPYLVRVFIECSCVSDTRYTCISTPNSLTSRTLHHSFFTDEERQEKLSLLL